MGKISLLDYRRTSIFGILAIVIAATWHLLVRFSPEFLRAFIYDRLLASFDPILVDYGPSAAMVGLGAYLYWLDRKSWRVGSEASAQVAPIHEVVAHAAKWIDDKDAAKYWPEARRAIRQAALDGQIKIRGHKSEETGNDSGTSWSLVSTTIPQNYWELAEIRPCASTIMFGDDLVAHTFPHKLSDGRFTQERIAYYANLTANWSEVRRTWPLNALRPFSRWPSPSDHRLAQ
jgi:hypothetical protein